MVEKLNYIELADGFYPIKCDLAVLEAVQEEYGKLSIFERELSGIRKTEEKDEKGKPIYKTEEPSMRAVRFVLPLMINEGIDVENHLEGTRKKHIKESDLKCCITGVNILDIAYDLHREFVRCFETKNRNSTQEEKNNR